MIDLDGIQLHHGDCRQVLASLPDCSVDSVVTDPPYELGFMGKAWDGSGIAYSVEMWAEVLRVLKPGGHLCAFGGTRTYHRMACAIEDAGFEIRDSLHWVYGSGFPKSLDVSKAIDKAAGAEREVVASVFRGERAGTSAGIKGTPVPRTDVITTAATDAAKQWEGWGTALKPAHETVILARKGSNDTVDFSPVPILEVALWLLSSANDAIGSSKSNRADYAEALSGSARKLAEQQPAIPADLLEATAMWLSAWATDTSWNIVSSWLNTWAEICEAMSMSTTSTGSSTTTLLRTFKCLVGQITHGNTIPDVTTDDGRSSPAWLAVETLCDALLNLSDTLGLPAPASATSVLQQLCRAEDGDIAHEPIVLARKPLISTVAANVLTHGTGALNIDGARVEGEGAMKWASPRGGIWTTDSSATADLVQNDAGRWPANVIFDTEAGALLDEQADGASRFFTSIEWEPEIDVPFRYVPKPGKQERTCEGTVSGSHPTVKPLALMRWLVRLVTPPGGTVLEPFAGSGTTLMACVLEGFNGIGIEMTDEYLPIIEGRVRWAQAQPPRLFL